jgi:hypothetical protein
MSRNGSTRARWRWFTLAAQGAPDVRSEKPAGQAVCGETQRESQRYPPKDKADPRHRRSALWRLGGLAAHLAVALLPIQPASVCGLLSGADDVAGGPVTSAWDYPDAHSPADSLSVIVSVLSPCRQSPRTSRTKPPGLASRKISIAALPSASHCAANAGVSSSRPSMTSTARRTSAVATRTARRRSRAACFAACVNRPSV